MVCIPTLEHGNEKKNQQSKGMNVEHPPAMHHKRWRHDHCHRAETPGHSTKTTQRHCGQVEHPILNDGVASLLNLGKQQPLNS